MAGILCLLTWEQALLNTMGLTSDFPFLGVQRTQTFLHVDNMTVGERQASIGDAMLTFLVLFPFLALAPSQNLLVARLIYHLDLMYCS